jgi:hypothetical protein
MRSEKEMFDLILGVAQKDERFRAVYMNVQEPILMFLKTFFRTTILFML